MHKLRLIPIVLILARVATAQINLPDDVSPYEPIIAKCQCTPPPAPDGTITEIKIRWNIGSDNVDKPAYIRLVEQQDQPDQAHIWGNPGYHQLTAATTWVQFEIIEVTDTNGQIRKIRNFIGWDTETYQHRFLIRGKIPDPNNRPPVANAGEDQAVKVGDLIRLDGSGSSDPDGDQLEYSWALARPSGSQARLSQKDISRPTFTADVAGTYKAQLRVNDGRLQNIDTVTISTDSPNPEGPRFVVILHESQDLTPARSKLYSDLEVYDTDLDKKNRLHIFDKDAGGAWLQKYLQAIADAGVSLPAIVVVDQSTGKGVHIGPAPTSINAYKELLKK